MLRRVATAVARAARCSHAPRVCACGNGVSARASACAYTFAFMRGSTSGSRWLAATAAGAAAAGPRLGPPGSEEAMQRVGESLLAQAEYAQSQPKGELRRSLAVSGYYEGGFALSSGQTVDGALLCAGETVASWAPTSPAEVTPESLRMLELLWPPVETLIVGTGAG